MYDTSIGTAITQFIIIIVQFVSCQYKIFPLPIMGVDHPLGGQSPQVASGSWTWDLCECRNILRIKQKLIETHRLIISNVLLLLSSHFLRKESQSTINSLTLDYLYYIIGNRIFKASLNRIIDFLICSLYNIMLGYETSN